MPNNLTSNLILDRVGKRSLTYLGNVLAPFTAFSTDFSTEEFTQGQNVRIPVATVGATTQVNPTNWESGDSNISNVNVLVSQYSVSFQLTPRELNNGFRLDQLVDINLQSFGNRLVDVAFAPFTAANFTTVNIAQASLTGANLATAWAAIARSSQKNVILDSTAYSRLLPTSLTTEIGPRPGLAGFDGIYLNTRWSGAGANVYGFAGGPGAVALVAGLPVTNSDGMDGLEQSVVSVQIGGRGSINQGLNGPTLPVLTSTWLSMATRTRWVSFDVMMGASATGDSSSGYLFRSP